MPHAWQKCPKKGEQSFFFFSQYKKGVGNKRKQEEEKNRLILVDNTKAQLETIGPLLGFDFLIS